MKINGKSEHIKYFDELDPGNVFLYGGSYYLKIKPFRSATAVSLGNSTLTYVKGDEMVLPVDCEMVIY